MRVFAIVLCVLMLLSGCTTVYDLETISDVYDVQVNSSDREIVLALPEGASQAVLVSDEGDSIYFCDGFSVAVCTLDSGDLSQTIQEITGFEKSSLTVITTTENGFSRHAFAWTSLGEEVQQICKGVILDDGYAHYAVTVMCDYTLAADLMQEINCVLDSVTLRTA